MTIASEVSKVVYSANGSTTSWPFTFRVLDASHLKVIVTTAAGVATTLSAGYSVNLSSGVVTYPTSGNALASGNKLTLLREMPYVQNTDYQNQGPFVAEVHELSLDYLTMLCQQLKEALARCLKAPVTESSPESVYQQILDARDAANAGAALCSTASALANAAAGAANAAAANARSIALQAAQVAKDTANVAAGAANAAASRADTQASRAEGVANRIDWYVARSEECMVRAEAGAVESSACAERSCTCSGLSELYWNTFSMALEPYLGLFKPQPIHDGGSSLTALSYANVMDGGGADGIATITDILGGADSFPYNWWTVNPEIVETMRSKSITAATLNADGELVITIN